MKLGRKPNPPGIRLPPMPQRIVLENLARGCKLAFIRPSKLAIMRVGDEFITVHSYVFSPMFKKGFFVETLNNEFMIMYDISNMGRAVWEYVVERERRKENRT